MTTQYDAAVSVPAELELARALASFTNGVLEIDNRPAMKSAAEKTLALIPQIALNYGEEITRPLTVAVLRATYQDCNAPELAAQFWRETVECAPWFDSMRECVIALLLDVRYRIMSYSIVSIGTLSESFVHPRDVFRSAIVASAFAVILIHNHPSGDPTPSKSDRGTTQRLTEAAELVQIKFLDHIIVGRDRIYSSESDSLLELAPPKKP
jgi:DNA repair protein RadC